MHNFLTDLPHVFVDLAIKVMIREMLKIVGVIVNIKEFLRGPCEFPLDLNLLFNLNFTFLRIRLLNFGADHP